MIRNGQHLLQFIQSNKEIKNYHIKLAIQVQHKIPLQQGILQHVQPQITSIDILEETDEENAKKPHNIGILLERKKIVKCHNVSSQGDDIANMKYLSQVNYLKVWTP